MATTIRHYRGDTATYTFSHALDSGDITKVSFYVRDSIDGALRLATNSDDHAAAWSIGASAITLTLDAPDSPAAATTTSIALTKIETQFAYDVQAETAAAITTIAYGAFTLIGDVVTPTVDGDLPDILATDIVDALEAASNPNTANPFVTASVLTALELDDLADVNAPAPTDGQALVWDDAESEWVAGDMAGGSVAWGDVTGTPTTLAGYGISDAAAAVHNHDDRYYTEAEVTSLIANFITQAQGDVRYGQLGTANTWAQAQTFTGQVLGHSNNTSGAPAFSFSGDTDIGMYREAENTLVLKAGSHTFYIATNFFLTNQVFIQNVGTALTATELTELEYRHNTSGTPAAGFGSHVLWRLESSTTTDQNAARERVYWSDATHASRTSRFAVQTVYNAGALVDTIAAGRTGAADSTGLWLYDETAASLKQVMRGAADSGGAGFRLLRVAN